MLTVKVPAQRLHGIQPQGTSTQETHGCRISIRQVGLILEIFRRHNLPTLSATVFGCRPPPHQLSQRLMAESSNAVEAADANVPSSDRLLALYLSGLPPHLPFPAFSLLISFQGARNRQLTSDHKSSCCSALSLADFWRDAFFTSNNMQLQVMQVCSRSRCSLGLEQQLLLFQAQFECEAGLQAVDELR
jgi:hypothetical protein